MLGSLWVRVTGGRRGLAGCRVGMVCLAVASRWQVAWFKLRNMKPCLLANLRFDVQLPDDNEVLVTMIGMVVPLAPVPAARLEPTLPFPYPFQGSTTPPADHPGHPHGAGHGQDGDRHRRQSSTSSLDMSSLDMVSRDQRREKGAEAEYSSRAGFIYFKRFRFGGGGAAP